MARRSHVPKFGNWDSNDHMPFTAVFDNARQGRTRPVNPNDPAENVQAAGGGAGAPAKRYNINDPEDSMEASDVHQHVRQLQGGQQPQQQPGTRSRQPRPNNSSSQVPASQGNGVAPQQRGGAGHYRRPSRENVNEFSNNPSAGDNPPAYGAAGRGSTRAGVGSPAWDPTRRKSASGEEGHAFAPATPTKSRLRTGGNSGSRDEPATKGPSAVPRFGAWDAQDPGSGDGFTVIFNNARQEKIVGGPVNTMPGTPETNKASDLYADPSFGNSRGKQKKSYFCCRQM